MNAERHNRCEICGRPTPKDWDGVPAKRCMAHRIVPKASSRAATETADAQQTSGARAAAIVAGLAGVIAFASCLPPGEKDSRDDYDLIPRSMLHPIDNPDDGGPPYGAVKDPDKYMNPFG